MNRRKVMLAVTALVLAGVAAVAILRFSQPKSVPVLAVRAEPTERVLAVVGRVRPMDVVEVKPLNPGQVVRLLHDEGDRVAAGAPLAVIKSTIERAEAEAQRASLAAAEARAVEAAQALSRTSTLSERGFASQAALDQARAAKRTADAEVAAARATYRAASERTGEGVVTAPMAGIILQRPIDNGQVVAATTVLFELGAAGGFEIEAEVDEVYADQVKPGMAARLSPSGTQAIYAARVSEVSPRVNASTGGRLVRLVGSDLPELAPGRSVDVTIVVAAAQNRIVIPRQAVVEPTVAPKVFVVDAEGVVRAKPVRIAQWPSTGAIVEDGLTGGEQLVLKPEETKPGDRVRPAAP